MKCKHHVMYQDVANINGAPDTIKSRLAELLPHVEEEIYKRFLKA